MKSVAIYLGSAYGADQKYADFAYEVGRALALRGIEVIYGGANVGTMGSLARGVLENGGRLVGVFPKGFGGKREIQKKHIEILQEGMTETILTENFSERKAVMEQRADCAVALPGGIGTMDELFCFAVDNEIALHEKPAFILNFDGFYDGLKLQLETMACLKFLPSGERILNICDSLEDFLGRL